MLINNAVVFNSLIGTGAPSIAWTVYDPQVEWARTELETLNPGSIVIQVEPHCDHDREPCIAWLKRSRTAGNGSLDYVSLGPQGFKGTTVPTASDPDLCAAPIGSVYVKHSGDNCVDQVYLKINNTCSDAAVCDDWFPLVLSVTRTGSTFEWDAANFTLNVPVEGNLTLVDDGRYKWTPDNGDDVYYINVPTMTDNGDGTYTWSWNDGGVTADITITATVPTIPADISTVNRPWVKVGSASATNATNVGVADDIFHTGKLVRGAATIGTLNAAAELVGNNAGGAGNHDMTSGSNSAIAAGNSNETKSTSNAFVGGGSNNHITGAGAPGTNINNGVVAGRDNTITNSPDSIIGGGGSNTITNGASNFIGGGSANSINPGSQAFIGAGNTNQADGVESAVLAGRFNEANATIAHALGLKAQVSHDYAFLINTLPGANANTDSDPFDSASDSEFSVRCDNIRLFTNLAQTAGMTMAAGASAWVAVSDERTKEHITPVEADILAAYKRLVPVSYVQGDDDIGAGVTAQNFYHAFDWLTPKMVGEMYAINSMERDGVQDMAIKALIDRIEQLEARITELERGD